MNLKSHLRVYNISKLTFIFLVNHRSLLCVCYEWTLYLYTLRIWLGFKKAYYLIWKLSKLKTSSARMNFSLSKIEFNRLQTMTQNSIGVLLITNDEVWKFIGIVNHSMDIRIVASVRKLAILRYCTYRMDHICQVNYIIKWKTLT